MGYVKGKVNSKELERALSKLATTVDDSARGRALEQGGIPIMDSAKGFVPILSGDLRRSIKVSNWFKEGDKVKVRIGTNMVYAAMIEFGGKIKITPKMRAYLHAVLDIHPRATTTHINRVAQPYLRPAYNLMKGRALSTVAAELRRKILKL